MRKRNTRPTSQSNIQAETQQAHEKVQGASEGWSKGETNPEQHEWCISLKLQEEEEAQKEE